MLCSKRSEPVLRSLHRGVGGVDDDDRHPGVVGHLDQPVPQFGGGQPGNVPAEGPAPLPPGWSVPRPLSSFGAGLLETEVLNDDCSGVVVFSDGNGLGDRLFDKGIAGGARQSVEDERDGSRDADWVPLAVEDCDRQMADVQIDTDN